MEIINYLEGGKVSKPIDKSFTNFQKCKSAAYKNVSKATRQKGYAKFKARVCNYLRKKKTKKTGKRKTRKDKGTKRPKKGGAFSGGMYDSEDEDEDEMEGGKVSKTWMKRCEPTARKLCRKLYYDPIREQILSASRKKKTGAGYCGGMAGYEDEDYFGGARKKIMTKAQLKKALASSKTKKGKTKKGRITVKKERHTVRATKAMRLYHSGKAKTLKAAWKMV
jgi:hypothetical protein